MNPTFSSSSPPIMRLLRLFVLLLATLLLTGSVLASPKVGSVTVGPQSGTLTTGTAGSVTYTITVGRGSGSGSSGNFTADLSVTTALPTGVTASFSPNPVQLASQVDQSTATLTISTTAATPSGSTAFTVRARTSASDLAVNSGTLQVNHNPTITFTIPNKTYGDAGFAVNATSDSPGAITYAIVNGPISLSGNSVTITSAGSATIRASQAASGLFNSSTKDATFSIEKANLSVTADDKTKVFGTTDPALTATFTGLKYSDVPSAFNGLVLGRVAGENVGTYTITPSGIVGSSLPSSNYNINYSTGSFSITKAPQSISFSQTDVSFSALPLTLSAIGGDSGNPVTFSILNGPSGYSLGDANNNVLSGATTHETDETIKVRASQSGNSNYDPAPDQDVTFTLLENVAPISAFEVVTGTPGSNGWHLSNVTAKISATDTGSGVSQIKYSVDGGSEVTVSGNETAPFALTGDGTHTVAYKAIDANGNIASGSSTVKIDTTPPTITATPDRNMDHNDWFNHDVVVHFTTHDETSGSAGDPDDQTLTGTASATKQLTANAFDQAGNPATRTFSFKFDGTPPVIEPHGVGNGDKVQEVTVTDIDTFDISPIATTTRVSDPGPKGVFYDPTVDADHFSVASFPWSATADGNYSLYVSATDEAGNTAQLLWHFTRDHTKPDLTLGVPLSDHSPYYNINPFSVLYSLSDYLDPNPLFTLQRLLGDVSSADGQEFFKVDTPAGTLTNVAGPYSLMEGLFRLDLSAVDFAFNTATLNRVFLLDLSPPTTTPSFISGAPNADGWSKENVQILFSAADPDARPNTGLLAAIPGSDVKEVDLTVGTTATPFTGGSASFNLAVEGEVDLLFGAVDNAGNDEAPQPLTIRLDKTKPSINQIDDIKMTATGLHTPVTYSTHATDDRSGVKTLELSPDSGYAFPVGKTTVTATATDLAGNEQTSTFTVTIDKKTPIISFDPIADQVYGVGSIPLGVTSTEPDLDLSYVVEGPARWDGAKLVITGAGHVKVTISQTGDEWRNDAEDKPQKFDVAKKPLAVTANDAEKIYGDSDPLFSAAFDGFVTGEGTGNLSGTLILTHAGDGHVLGTPDEVVPSGLTSVNYDIKFLNGQLTIRPAPLTVKANDASKTYGEANPAFSESFTGLVNGDKPEAIGSALLTTDATQFSHVGSYDIVASAGTIATTDYDISFEKGTLKIDKRPLTVAADPKNRTYGSANPPLTYSAPNLVHNDPIIVSLSTTAGQHSNVAVYPITVDSVTDADDYDVTTADNLLSVTPADAFVQVSEDTFTYDGDPHGAKGTATGVFSEDLSAKLNLGDKFTNVPGGTAHWTFTGGTNYNDQSGDVTITISKANQTISWAKPADIVFGTTLSGAQLNATVAGVPGGSAPGALTYDPAAGTTLTPGHWTLKVTATATTNYNEDSKTVDIDVRYSYTDFLPPIGVSGHTTTGLQGFKLGSTIPVKFQLTGASGSIRNLVATIWAAKVDANVDPGIVIDIENVIGDSGNLFRYDAANNLYIFNLSTKGTAWSQGTWLIRAMLPDGKVGPWAKIDLKK